LANLRKTDTTKQKKGCGIDRGLCVTSDAIDLRLACWLKADILNIERDF